jgi:hypothetical protein
MPYILKQPLADSPGIITFTQNEALRGVAAPGGRVAAYLNEATRRGEWLFGIHIQGDMSNAPGWPREPWQAFFMWPDPSASFLHNIPAEDLIPLNCVNFIPGGELDAERSTRRFDLCIVSRPSPVKRIRETLLTIKALMNRRPDVEAILVVPDPRLFDRGEASYELLGLDRAFFELPKKLFSSDELARLSFISSSQTAFGTFPLSDRLIRDLYEQSKFVLLTSHSEGTPRVIAEALIVGTPCIVSKHLRSGILHYLDDSNAVRIDDDPEAAAAQIDEALSAVGRFRVDRAKMRAMFSAEHNRQPLLDHFAAFFARRGKPMQGRWFLDDLHLRLACHGRKHNYQFMSNEALFFEWIGKVRDMETYDEDALFGSDPLDDVVARPWEAQGSGWWQRSVRAVSHLWRA